MNFDLADVRPFLNQLNSELGMGLEVNDVATKAEILPVGESIILKMDILDRGAIRTISIEMSMDDIDSPDIYFFSHSQDLTLAIQGQMIAFAETRTR